MDFILDEGFWSIFGAIVGAFLGAFLGFIVTVIIDFRRTSNLKNALYTEANFISTYISNFLMSVIEEYKKVKIDIKNGDEFSAPSDIDFSTIKFIYLELYKTNHIPSEDHRRFIHNICSQWEMIHRIDKGRVEKSSDDGLYIVNRDKCMVTIHPRAIDDGLR